MGEPWVPPCWVKEAGLVALGRAIHLPPKRKAAAPA
jgi:hypothetical protein